MTTISIGWVFALLSTLGQSPSDEPTLGLNLSLGTAAPPQMEEVLRGQFLGFGIAFSNRTAQRLEREHNAAGYTLPDEARVVLRAEGDERPWSAVVEARLVRVGGDEAAEVVLPEAYFDREFDARWPAPVGTTVGGSPVTFPVYVSPEDSALLEPGEYEFRVRFELPGVGGAHLETPHLDVVHSFTLEEPDDPQHELAILQSRAVYHLWFGQPEVAAAAAEAILAADPSFGGGSAYSLAADAYEKGEDPANAIRILELSMSRLPDSATDVRAAVERRIGKLRARLDTGVAPPEKQARPPERLSSGGQASVCGVLEPRLAPRSPGTRVESASGRLPEPLPDPTPAPTRSPMLRFLAVALVSLAFCALAQASDLSLDGGKLSVDKLMASDMTIAVTGTPGARVSVYLDLDPGPTLVDGVSVPIGFSPAWTAVPLGTVGPDGLLEARFKLPVDPAFHEMTVYAAAIGFLPNGSYEVSNGVDITLRDRNVQLAGRTLAGYPSFEFVRAAQVGDTIEVAVETSRFPELVDRPGDVYVVASRTRAEWIADPGLTDIVGGPVAIDLVAGPLADNTIAVDVGTLSGDAGTDIGVGYDVVLDMNRDGRFNGDDLIDGYEDESGFYVVENLTQPGPLDVTEILYTGGAWLGQNTYYPTDIDSMGALPLVVVSHGNGHNYQWYDHIGEHLASYGYVVMSHQNQTGPGIGSASTTTLTNTDYFLGNLDTIGGGVLDGHIDSSRMTWIGHSRGGEGILRAYDRIVDGVYTPTHFDADDVQLLSSIAPTAFLAIAQADPHDTTFSLWTGGADSDVNGCTASDITQTFQLHDRAEQERISISLHGAGHGDFHDGGGSNFANGPCKIGRVRTHVIMRSYLLPLVKHVIDGNLPAKDYLWRQWEGFVRLGGPSDTACVVVDLQYREGPEVGSFVIDDYQLNDDDLGQSSSGGLVTAVNLTDHLEGLPNDNNPTFTLNPNDPWNGFTYARNNGDMRHSIVEYMGDASLEFAILPGDADFTDHAYLSFRSCQATRNPLTIAELGDTTFDVTLTDTAGASSTINVGAYGGGIEEPYQRTGCGVGAGWANEYETIRMRLTDFQHDGSGLDLSSIASLRFDFGPSHGSPGGRLGLDDIQLTVD